MLLRFVSVFCLLFACACACACATAQPAAEPAPADDTALLRDRVARLERRLSDVDAKIGLLLVQRPQSRQVPGYRAADDAGRQEESSVGGHVSSRAARGATDEGTDREGEALGRGATDEDAVTLRAGPDGTLVVEEGMRSLSRQDAGTRAPSPSIDETYAGGHAQLKLRHEAAAIDAFEEVLRFGPEHDLADNALYWIGAAQLQRGAPQLAVDAWQRLPQRFPRSPKIPDALYGMAQAHEAMGEPALAETLYDELLTQYPRAGRARDAKRALRRLRP